MYFADFGDSVIVELFARRGNLFHNKFYTLWLSMFSQSLRRPRGKNPSPSTVLRNESNRLPLSRRSKGRFVLILPRIMGQSQSGMM